MWLRRAVFRWLAPAAAVLPIWLLVGWIISDAGGWALLWVLLIAIPTVAIGELVLLFLIRARGTVRHSGAVSWLDVAGIAAWHVLTIAVGFFPEAWFIPLLIGAIVVYIAVLWSSLWQLFQEARPSAVFRRYTAAAEAGGRGEQAGVVVIEERREQGR